MVFGGDKSLLLQRDWHGHPCSPEPLPADGAALIAQRAKRPGERSERLWTHGDDSKPVVTLPSLCIFPPVPAHAASTEDLANQPHPPLFLLREIRIYLDFTFYGTKFTWLAVLNHARVVTNAALARSSALMDAGHRHRDVGIESLFPNSKIYSRILAAGRLVFDNDCADSTGRGVHTVPASAYERQSAQTRDDHHTSDLRSIRVDAKSYVSRSVNLTVGLGHKARHVERTFGATFLRTAHSVYSN